MLYIVATPIGNLGEITYRAVETLKSVDAILCEDTRRTAILLRNYDIARPLVSYQKFSEREKCGYVIDRLKKGENLALVSDAGMPLISDPGKILVDELIKENLEYTVVSGPCALVNAVVLSGMDTSAFCMVGFLPEKKIDRVRHVERFKDLTCTLIFYSPLHNVRSDLQFLFEQLGDRRFAVVIEGAKEKSSELCETSVVEHVEFYIASGLDKKDAIKKVASERKVAKSLVYSEYEKKLEERAGE